MFLCLWEGVCVYGQCVRLWEGYVNGKSGNWKEGRKISTEVEKVKRRKIKKFGKTSELLKFFCLECSYLI